MTHYQAPILVDDTEGEAAQSLLRLRNVLTLVEQIAGDERPSNIPVHLDEQLDNEATLALAYATASSVTRRRFDALAGEAASFASAGLSALIQHKQRMGRDCHAGARQLATDMRHSIEAMTRMIEAAGRH